MKIKQYLLLISLILILAGMSGCDTISNLLVEETPLPATPTPTSEPTPTPGTLGVDAPISLQLWVPPEFDPEGDSEAAVLLRERLDEYSRLNPGIRVVTRVKASEGDASLIESLSASVSAAPLALPDLVLLSNQDARTAAESNLIYALQSEIDFSTGNDWYGFAGDLVSSADQTWGVPFAADVMVMVYRPSLTPEAPTNWESFFETGQRLVFPASDPQGLFPLALYISESDYQTGQPGFGPWDRSALEEVFNFINQSQASNLMPYWLTQMDTDQLAWDAFLNNQAELGITWMSRYLQEAPEHISAASIPTQDGSAATLATGWVWAVATPNLERQAAAEDLAMFLAEADFSGAWTEAAGLLPVRPSALSVWESGSDRTLATRLLPSATATPSETMLSIIGPPLQAATTGLLKQELTLAEAVTQAWSQLETEGN